MPKIDRPREGRGRGPTGEKHPCSAEASGGQSAGLIPPCDLCALLLRRIRNRPKPRRAPRGAGRGLRIALVDNDEATRLAARKMVQAQRDGWILDTCRSCCLASGASGLPQKLRLGPDTHTR
jgi:hypothetical protein